MEVSISVGTSFTSPRSAIASLSRFRHMGRLNQESADHHVSYDEALHNKSLLPTLQWDVHFCKQDGPLTTENGGIV
jgi:hypothetical protein